MNTDRLLTRVFDKQEKKMLYVGDYIKAGDRYIQTKDCAVLKGFTVGGMITTDGDNIWFGDRFVPMMCSGFKLNDLTDKSQLVYEGDIIKSTDSSYLVYWRAEYAGFLAKCLTETLDLSLDNFKYVEVFGETETRIIGNRWENPELWELSDE